jgi:hypothetical protein
MRLLGDEINLVKSENIAKFRLLSVKIESPVTDESFMIIQD